MRSTCSNYWIMSFEYMYILSLPPTDVVHGMTVALLLLNTDLHGTVSRHVGWINMTIPLHVAHIGLVRVCPS